MVPSPAAMPLHALVRQLQAAPLTAEVRARCERPERLRLNGAGRAARALIASALAAGDDAPLLVIVPTLEEAGRWASLLELMGWPLCQLYPTSEGSPYEPFDPTSEITWGQLQVLAELVAGAADGDGGSSGRFTVVATERALQPHLPPPPVLAERCLTLRRGDRLDLEELALTLAGLGYERVPTIEQEGTWSRRGDIIDVFPVSAELPVRLELFGEDLEKLREFDPASQRSLDVVDRVRLTPTSYAPLIAEALRQRMPEGLERLLDPDALDLLLEGGTPEGMRRLMGLAWDDARLPARLPAPRHHGGDRWAAAVPGPWAAVVRPRRRAPRRGGELPAGRATPPPCPCRTVCTGPRPPPWRRRRPSPGSIWRSSARATGIPTPWIWPAGRSRPTPTSSAAWRSRSRPTCASGRPSGSSLPSRPGPWPCWRNTTASPASCRTPATSPPSSGWWSRRPRWR